MPDGRQHVPLRAGAPQGGWRESPAPPGTRVRRGCHEVADRSPSDLPSYLPRPRLQEVPPNLAIHFIVNIYSSMHTSAGVQRRLMPQARRRFRWGCDSSLTSQTEHGQQDAKPGPDHNDAGNIEVHSRRNHLGYGNHP